MRSLKRKFPNGLAPKHIGSGISPSKHSSLSADDIEGLRSFVPIDRVSISKNESFKKATKVSLARKFFDGYGPEVFTVALGIPAVLHQDIGLEKEIWKRFNGGDLAICILGEAGSGKSTFTYSTLINTENPEANPVFLFRENATSITVSLLALERHLNSIDCDFGVVLVDDLHIYSELLGEVYSNNRLRKVRILSSARQSEWYARISRSVGPEMKTLEYQRFDSNDIDSLIEKISTFYPSPTFTKLSRVEKYANFKKSKRQLLVALREATSVLHLT